MNILSLFISIDIKTFMYVTSYHSSFRPLDTKFTINVALATLNFILQDFDSSIIDIMIINLC